MGILWHGILAASTELLIIGSLIFQVSADMPHRSGIPVGLAHSSNASATNGPACINIPPARRADCGTRGPLGVADAAGSCQDRSCCWQPTQDKADTDHVMPWCYYNQAAVPPPCDVTGPKIDCGYVGIDQGACEAKGCCWRRSGGNEPWCYAARPNPPNSDVMVHLFEWRWDDIEKECVEVLGPAGYKAVQVSPPQEDVKGNQWWTRYQPVSYQIFSRSGDRAAFEKMVKTCYDNGVDIVVDGVLNHMANGEGRGRSNTPYGKRYFPSMYSSTCGDFHHNTPECANNCIASDDTNAWNLQNCDLGTQGDMRGLPDLRTGSPYVQSQLAGYLNDLASLGVAGMRLDAAKHIYPPDLWSIISRVQPVNRSGSPPMYFNQEVIIPAGQGNMGIRPHDFYGIGRIWEFKLVNLYNKVFKSPYDTAIFKQLNADGPTNLFSAPWADSRLAMSFFVNHDKWLHGSDRPNSVTLNDGRDTYELALITLLAHEYGQPNIFSSYQLQGLDKVKDANGTPPGGDGTFGASHDCKPEGEGTTFNCEHRWPAVKAMVQWRRVAGRTRDVKTYDAVPKGISIRRDNAFMILSLGDGSQAFKVTENTGLPEGSYCNVVLGKSKCDPSNRISVGRDGFATFTIPDKKAVAIHIQEKASVETA